MRPKPRKTTISRGMAIIEKPSIIFLIKPGLKMEPITFPIPEKINNAAARIIPPSVKNNFTLLLSQLENSPFLIGNFSNNLAAVTPAMVAQAEPNNEVPMIIAGSELPAAALTAIAVAGINVIPAVFIARKVHIAFVAVPFSGFISSSSSIAFKPKGVAAFPSPSILADIFIIIGNVPGHRIGVTAVYDQVRRGV